MNETKPWYTSKTLRVNVAAAALVALEANFNLLQPLLPINFYQIMAVALPVVNGMLRVVTSAGITAR